MGIQGGLARPRAGFTRRLAVVAAGAVALAGGAAPAYAAAGTTVAYVADFSGNDVSVINTATGTVTATIPVGGGPAGVAVFTLPPAAALSADPTSIIDGQSSTLTWSSTNATSCTGTNFSTGGATSGTATVSPAATTTYTVTCAGNGVTAPPATATVDVSPAPLKVTATSLPAATLGTGYSAPLAATGGTPPYTWTVTSGALPPGLSLSPGGTISGTPVMAGTFPLTVQGTDSASPAQTATASLSITVGAGPGGTLITGRHAGPLTLGRGVTVLSGATITGPVTITPGAIVSITGSAISGPLRASGPASLAVCGTQVTGPVSVTGATGPVLVGGGSGSPCTPDTITGPVTLSGNTGGVTVAGNTIDGPLSCTSNTPPPGDNGQPNTVSGPATGQCATLA